MIKQHIAIVLFFNNFGSGILSVQFESTAFPKMKQC